VSKRNQFYLFLQCMQLTKNLKSFLIIFVLGLLSVNANAQLMNHYWSQSYNSISSLLSGAVVAGDAGNAAIYYNPANIVEIEKGSNISLAASFLTYNFYHMKNVMGEGRDLTASNFYVQPQFFSVGVNSPFNKMSFEIATYNRVKEQLTMDFIESQTITDDNDNNYTSLVQYHYRNYYSDDWIGLGAAYSFNDAFHFGVSLNVSFSTLNYTYYISRQIHSDAKDTTSIPAGQNVAFADNEYNEKVDFTNVRIITRIGASYKTGNWKFGLNLSLPPLTIMTLGEKASRSIKETYYNGGQEGGEFSNYSVFDAGGDDKLDHANYKLPFSIAFGVIFYMNDNKKIYTTIEYFAGLQPYKMIDASSNSVVSSGIGFDDLETNDWLSFAYGAVPVLNLAIGYRWQIKPRVLFLMGLRTDFNNIKNFDYGDLAVNSKLKTTVINIYHATGGVQFHYKKHQLVAGTQLSFGMETDRKQIANIGSSLDFNSDDRLPLLGVTEDKTDAFYFSISLFIGATFNFQKEKQIPKD